MGSIVPGAGERSQELDESRRLSGRIAGDIASGVYHRIVCSRHGRSGRAVHHAERAETTVDCHVQLQLLQFVPGHAAQALKKKDPNECIIRIYINNLRRRRRRIIRGIVELHHFPAKNEKSFVRTSLVTELR